MIIRSINAVVSSRRPRFFGLHGRLFLVSVFVGNEERVVAAEDVFAVHFGVS